MKVQTPRLSSIYRFKSFSLIALFVICVSFFAFTGTAQLEENTKSNTGLRPTSETAKSPGIFNYLTISASPTPTPDPNLALHTLVGAFYTFRNGFQSKLLLNNKGIQPVEVTPTLYSASGAEFQLPPVSVAASSGQIIDLQNWVNLAGNQFQSGNLKLFHRGKDLVLGAQIYIEDLANGLSFDEKLAETGKFDSRRLEGIWYQPEQTTKVKIALTNTTANALSVNARLTRKPRNSGDWQTISLAPHETKLLDLQDDFSDGTQFANFEALALSLEHAGGKYDLLARAMVFNRQNGYSNTIQFSNPLTGKSKQYHGAGWRLKIGSEKLTPIIVARNTAATDANLTGRVPYTRNNGTTGTVELPNVRLRPNEVKLLDLRDVIARNNQENIKIAGIEFEYDTAEGSVQLTAQSISDDQNQVFRVPLYDPLAQRSPTGGYPFRLSNESATRVYLKNTIDAEEDYVAFLLYGNGNRYMIGLKSLKPHQTIEIDLKKLRDDQTPDERGNVIPLSVTEGQFRWTLRRKDNLPEGDEFARLAIVGRSEQIDTAHKTSSNYACQNCCDLLPFGFGFIYPNNAEFESGSVVQYEAYETEYDCYGGFYSLKVAPYEWSSSETTIATVSQVGVVTTNGVGTARIKAKWYSNQLEQSAPCQPGLLADCPAAADVSGEKVVPKKEAENVLNLAECGSCVTRLLYLSAETDVKVKPKVGKIQYQEPNTSNFIDITSTLFILKGTTVTFKAISNPANATFPSGQPVWSGTSGATGTGQTNTVTFNTTSQNTTDYKTVIASAGTPVSINVIVYDLTGTFTPQDMFPNRSLDKFGILEVVDLSASVVPSVSISQIGLQLEWTKTQGNGNVTNSTNNDGTGEFTAGQNGSFVDFKLSILNGVSKGGNVTYTKTVVEPNDAYMVKDAQSDIHCTNTCSAGFQGKVYLKPTDVSFSRIYFAEGGAKAVATGYFYPKNNDPHPPTIVANAVACEVMNVPPSYPKTNCNLAFQDIVYTGAWSISPYRIGHLSWNIEWMYGFNDTPQSGFILFTHGLHKQSSDASGTASIMKGGSVTTTIVAGAQTSGNGCGQIGLPNN